MTEAVAVFTDTIVWWVRVFIVRTLMILGVTGVLWGETEVSGDIHGTGRVLGKTLGALTPPCGQSCFGTALAWMVGLVFTVVNT